MKYQVEINISLLAGLFFVLSLFPFYYVNAEKVKIGVTITNPGTTTPPAGTCGLQIISGAPINYGQLTVGQVSNEQKVVIKNVGTAPGKVMVKGSAWTGGIPPLDTYSAEITRVAVTPGKDFGTKFALHTAEATILGDLGAGQTGESFWSVYGDNHLSGSPKQEVTIDLTC